MNRESTLSMSTYLFGSKHNDESVEEQILGVLRDIFCCLLDSCQQISHAVTELRLEHSIGEDADKLVLDSLLEVLHELSAEAVAAVSNSMSMT